MGRPRQFDSEAVLEGAVELFRERGYEGISIPELSERLGICRQSLYTTFGDKRALFLQALERYGQRETDAKLALLEREGSALENLRTVLRQFAGYGADCPNGGCLTVTALVESRDDEATLAVVDRQVGRLEEGLRGALERACEAGELRAEVDPARLARALLTTCQGIGLLSRLPGSRSRIEDAVDVALDLLESHAA